NKVHIWKRQDQQLSGTLTVKHLSLTITAMFVTVLLLWLCVWFVILQFKTRRPKNFPPGPPALPLVGNLLHLHLENPLKDFERLSRSYGDVYSLYLGSKPAVVINGLKAIKEAIVTKAADFSGRPQDILVSDVTQRKGVIMAEYGSSWRDHRRFALTTLRNFGLGKNSMEDRIKEEIRHTVQTLENSIGKTMSPQVMFHNAASNIICLVLFGRRYEYQDETIKVIVRGFTDITRMANGPWAVIYDSFPKIRNLPLPFKETFRKYETCKEIIIGLVEERKKTRVPGEPRHFVDCYLDELEKRGEDGVFSEDQLIINSLDLHFAGTDTTSNTLLTALLYLMNYPHAVIHEVQRVANTVPLSVFHCTTKDTELMGYSIPKGLARMELFLITVTLLRRFKFTWPEDAGEPDFTPVYGITLTPKPYRMKPRHFVDCYLDKLEKVCEQNSWTQTLPLSQNCSFIIDFLFTRRGEDSELSEDQLIINSLDLHFAGADTTSNTLLTAFLYLMSKTLLLSWTLTAMLVTVLLLSFCVWVFILQFKTRRPKNFPPGPPALPLLGNLLQLSLENPLQDFERPVVVIHRLKAMKEAIVVKAADFAGRPQDLLVNDVTQRKGVILADYGSSWRDHRRFALTTLRNFGLGKQSMEDRIHEEIRHTVQTLENSIGELSLYDSLSLIRPFPLPFKRAFDNAKICQDIVIKLLEEHKKSKVPGQPRDFVDCYLDEAEKRGADSDFTEDQLVMYSLDLHFAGTDTTSNTLLTGFLYLMNYPHIQERCQQEIDQVLGGRDRPSFEDRHNMPYMQAVIHEVQRVANTVPLSVFHCTTKNTELMGYSIPKGLARMELFLIMVTLLKRFKFTWPEDAGKPDFAPVYGVTLTPKPYRMKVHLRAA
ncbi:unnamed protein product, partial [Menidia menidia]